MPDSESARRGGSNERTFSEKCSKTKKIIFSTVYVLMKHKMTYDPAEAAAARGAALYRGDGRARNFVSFAYISRNKTL